MSENIWKELSRIALLGTWNTAPSKDLIRVMEQEGVDTGNTPELVLLQAAAYLLPYKKVEPTLKEAPATSFPAPPELPDGQPLNRKSIQHLDIILNQGFEKALPEFIHHMVANHKQLSPEFLPDLFYYCLENKAIWEIIQEGLDPLAWWLLPQNPDWQALSPMVDPNKWYYGSLEERQQYLLYLRRLDPQKGRILLEEFWPDLDYKAKVAFLKVMREGLQLEDESFLDPILDDKRKEVRIQAIQLLSALPQSNYTQTLAQEAADWITLNKGAISIQNAIELSPALERLGIGLKPHKQFKGGLQRVLMADIISKIPPTFWEKLWEKDEGEILQLFLEYPYAERIIPAIALAAIRFESDHWITAIATYWNQPNNWPRWNSAIARQLLQSLSNATFNDLVMQYLDRGGYVISDKSLAYHLIALGQYEWNDKLSLRIIPQFQEVLGSAHSYSWDTWHYRQILQVAAYACNPFLLERLKSGWPVETPIWRNWQKMVEQFIQVLYFRKEMISQLAQKQTD